MQRCRTVGISFFHLNLTFYFLVPVTIMAIIITILLLCSVVLAVAQCAAGASTLIAHKHRPKEASRTKPRGNPKLLITRKNNAQKTTYTAVTLFCYLCNHPPPALLALSNARVCTEHYLAGTKAIYGSTDAFYDSSIPIFFYCNIFDICGPVAAVFFSTIASQDLSTQGHF